MDHCPLQESNEESVPPSSLEGLYSQPVFSVDIPQHFVLAGLLSDIHGQLNQGSTSEWTTFALEITRTSLRCIQRGNPRATNELFGNFSIILLYGIVEPNPQIFLHPGNSYNIFHVAHVSEVLPLTLVPQIRPLNLMNTHTATIEGLQLVINDTLSGATVEVNVSWPEGGQETFIVRVSWGQPRELEEVGCYDVVPVEVVPGGEVR